MRRLRQLVLLLAPLALTAACEADLETTCVSGSCQDLPPSNASASTSASTGAGGGGGGSACFEGCNPEVVSGQTGEFPCEVEAALEAKCRRCHTNPPEQGAPFSFEIYADTQQLHDSTYVQFGSTLARWSLVQKVVEDGFMPLTPPTLDEPELQALVDWSCQCGPPRPANQTCD